MTNHPSYVKGQDYIIVRFTENLIIMDWSYNGTMKRFKKNTLYKLPTVIGNHLSKLGICYYVERLK